MARDYIRVKDWMYMNREKRTKPEFIEGVASFMNFVCEHDKIQHGMILCPCSHCGNTLHRKEEDVELHIVKYGFIRGYTTWVYHREILTPINAEEVDDINLFPEEEMEEMVEVAFGDPNHVEDSPPRQEQYVDEYEKYMNDARRPIYENAKYSTMSWFVQLFQIKCLNKWGNKSFTMLLKFLKGSIPLGNNVRDSWYEAQKIMSNLGLNCEKIHACPNDCVLYWKENSYKKECPTCGVSRYKKKAHTSKNNIPLKVVRYFPITQRLQRLYKCKKTAVAMTWHDRALPSEDGKMSHPRDSPAWKNFEQNRKCSPGNNIDVYPRPLIEELRSLFINGVETYDADKGETFIMRAALMWTINDFPAYGMLSGYSVHGYKVCPYCHVDTTSTWLPFSKKICYCGHRRMLKEDHLYRDVHFDGTTEHRKAPVTYLERIYLVNGMIMKM
ncbi:uncharacterized protein LOC109839229 [Asparagus officinalis]|uniref:uncharacterized protein LOC109839229 n=1 Tax=Asparagus officinalis TaxID=4686 RepID=UPI00098E3470|nr:uncharacterized protein LOC109839229 [Asparagus officinalis]